MRVFHRTRFAATIFAEGFRDGEGSYLVTWPPDSKFRGVWVTADEPLDEQDIPGPDVLVLEIPAAVFEEYEWVEEGKGYREALVPAEILNRFGPPTLAEDYSAPKKEADRGAR